MDIVNLWTETGDRRTDGINIVKSWLCGSTEGQTYSITDNILDFDATEIENAGFEYEFPEEDFNDIVGFKTDYSVDNPRLESLALSIYEGLINLNESVKRNPERFFEKRRNFTGPVKVCGLPNHIHVCDYAVWNDTKGCEVCTNGVCCPFKGEKA